MTCNTTVGKLKVPLIAETKQFEKKMAAARKTTQALHKNIKSLGKVALGIGVAGFTALAFAVQKVSVSAMSVESAFAGVTKTTDGLVDAQGEMTEMGEKIYNQFRALAKTVPVAIEELMGIGEIAGQLGIPEQALVDFTNVVADLSVTTNLTKESAAQDLARIANIYEIAASEMAGNTMAIGNVIVELGNNFATTETEILSFAERIAAAGKVSGITQAEIMAIGAAFSSVGVEAARGGTATQKVLMKMTEAVATGGESLETFAETAGWTAKEFADTFEVDAAGAFEAFVQGLGKQGDEAFGTLEDLELADQRLIQAFISLAGSGDLLGDALASANEQMAGGNALAEEAAKRYATSESKIQIFKNRIRDMGLTLGNLVLPPFNALMDLVSNLIPEFEDLESLPVYKWLEKLSEELTEMINAIQQGFDPFEQFMNMLGDMGLDGLADTILRIKSAFEQYMVPLLQFLQKHVELKDILIALGIAIGYFALTVAASIAPVILTFMGIVAVVALVRKAWESNFLGIQEKTAVFVAWLKANVPPAIEFIRTKIQAIVTWFQTNIPPAIEFIRTKIQVVLTWLQSFWQKHGQKIMSFVALVWDTIKLTYETTMMAISAIITLVLNKIKAFIEKYFSGVIEIWKNNGNTIQKTTKNFADFIKRTWQRMWELIKTVVKSGITIVRNIMFAIQAIIKGDTEGFKEAIKNIWIALKDTVIQIANTWWNNLKDLFQTLYKELDNMTGGKLSEFVNQWKEKLRIIKENVDMRITQISNIFKRIGKAIKKVLDKIRDLKKALKNLSLPGFLTPGSPTPFEYGLRGIDDAMQDLVSSSLPELNAQLTATQQAQPTVASLKETNYNFEVNANYADRQSESSISRDLESLALMMGLA